MISSSSSWLVWRAASNRRSTSASCSSQRCGIVRVVEHQALDAVRARPFPQVQPTSAPPSKRSGIEPGSSIGRPIQMPSPVASSSASRPSRHRAGCRNRAVPPPLARRAEAQLLEVRDVLARDAGGVRHLLELGAVVERHCEHLRPGARARGRPVDLLELRVLAQRLGGRAVREEVLQLGPARHRRRAAVPRHRERAAGIGVLAAVLDRLIPQVAAQKAAHEGVAGAEDVEHLDREARALDALFDVVGMADRTPRSPSARA